MTLTLEVFRRLLANNVVRVSAQEAVLPRVIHRPEGIDHPTGPLFCEDGVELRMPFEHTAPDKMSEQLVAVEE